MQVGSTFKFVYNASCENGDNYVRALRLNKGRTARMLTSPPHLDVFSNFEFRALKIFTFCDGGWVARVARMRHGAGEKECRQEESNASLHHQVPAPPSPTRSALETSSIDWPRILTGVTRCTRLPFVTTLLLVHHQPVHL